MTDGKKEITLFPSSRAKRLTPHIVCLMASQTIQLEMTYLKHDHGNQSKSHKKWNTDQVMADRSQTREASDEHMIRQKHDLSHWTVSFNILRVSTANKPANKIRVMRAKIPKETGGSC